MATREESWRRLRSERWAKSDTFRNGLRQSGASVQSMTAGAGGYVYDEYSVLIGRMPGALTPEAFLSRMLSDLNGTVNNTDFNAMNVFRRVRTGAPVIGEIIEIDILGPDNGSVALAERGPDYFIFQTVTTPAQGSHPEYGAREFGFERLAGTVGFTTPRHSAVAVNPVKFYTRGISRPGNALIGMAGETPQTNSWLGLVNGIAASIRRLGGAPLDGTVARTREVRTS